MTDSQPIHEIPITPDQASAVISEAKLDKYGDGPVYSGTLPESEEQRVAVARELLGFAIDAYTAEGIRGDEVTSILKLGGIEIAEDGSWQHTASSQNGTAPHPEEPAEQPDPEPEENTNHGEPAEVEVTLVAGTGEEVDTVLGSTVYESLIAAGFEIKNSDPRETERERLEPEGNDLDLPGPPPAEGPPEDETTGDPARGNPDLSGEEEQVGDMEPPWAGYDTQKATDIKARLSESDVTPEMIEYVKEYESKRKKPRVRILRFEPPTFSGTEMASPEPEYTGPASEGHAELDAQADAAIAKDDEREELPPRPEEEVADAAREADEAEHHGLLSETESRELALAEIAKSNLPIPRDVESPPEFPEDLTDLSDLELHQLHSKFNACLSVAIWKLGLVQVDEKAWKHIADKRALQHMKSTDRFDDKTGRNKAQDRIEAEAESQDDVQVARDRQHTASLRKIPLQKLEAIYESHVEVLSRQWTMRTEELQSSGGLSDRRKIEGES